MKNIKITDVREVPGDSAFLIDDGKTSILYDTGFGFTGDKIAKNIKRILGKRKLDFIFLTHSHYDHALGSSNITAHYPDTKVVAGEYAAKIFKKDSAKKVMREMDLKFAKKCEAEDYPDLTLNLRVDIPVYDNDIIKAGDMIFRVINLPGHTKCSIGYYLESEKLLLSCETIGVYNGSDDVVPVYLVGYEMTIASIDKVLKFDIENILIPHYGFVSGEKAKKYLKLANENTAFLAGKIKEMLLNGSSDDEIYKYYKDKYYKGYITEIYPLDAMKLNTGIMIELIKRELL